MKIPRWCCYPALAVLIGMPMAVVISPRTGPDPHAGAALAARAELPPAEHPRVVVLGIDGLDPDLLQEAIDRFPDRTENFQWIAGKSGIHELGTSTPPQSPVAWSNFITGLDPGGHGIFDFIHRDYAERMPAASTVKPQERNFLGSLLGQSNLHLGADRKMTLLAEPENNRTGTAFWTLLQDEGIPADLWRMPINFPVEPAQGVSFPGMMTPALDSAYGESTIFTDDALMSAETSYAKLRIVKEFGGKIDTYLTGPENSFRESIPGNPDSHGPLTRSLLTIYIDRDSNAVAVDTGEDSAVLRPGEWSDWLTVKFDMTLPDFGLMDLGGIVRFYLRSIEPLELYASPINIDPELPAMPVSKPDDASEKLAKGIGRYYTQGMAEDVNSLKRDLISVEEFIEQVTLVYDERRAMMDYALDRYIASDEGGLLFFYFSTVDLTSHMMWRHGDPEHPHHEPEIAARSSETWTGRPGSTWKDTTYDVILKIDPVLGRLRERLGDDVTYIVMSDHGFAPYRREFSLNTWLLEEGYLVLQEGRERELPRDDPNHTKVYIANAVDWTETRAYGMGFNGLYLNLEGRELDNPLTPDVVDPGIVSPGAEADALLAELKRKLEAIVDPKTGERVVLRADLATEVYEGDRVPEAPDIVVGYNWAYGNADNSSEGRIPNAILQDNLGGTFNGSHLMAPEVVGGILISNHPVRQGSHELEDLTVEILHRYDVEPGPGMNGHPVLAD